MAFDRFDNDTDDEPRDSRPAARRRERFGGMSCMLGVLALVAALVLVVLALLLPPFSLVERLTGAPFQPIGPDGTAVAADGLTLSLPSGAAASSASNLGVRLDVLTRDAFLGQPGPADATLREAREALPQALTLVSPVYRLYGQGSGTVTLRLDIPPGADPARLVLYRYDSAARAWRYLPARDHDGALIGVVAALPDAVAMFRAPILVPAVSLVIEPGQALTPAMAEMANVVHPAGLKPITSGALQGALPAGVVFGRGYAVVPVIRNFDTPGDADTQIVSGLLRAATFRDEHISRLVEFVLSQPYQGLAIDYRDLSPDTRESFSRFVALLADALHAQDRTLTVVVPFPETSGESIDSGAYDWQAISAAADAVQFLLPLAAPLYSENGPVRGALDAAIRDIGPAKLQVGLSALSAWQQGDEVRSVTYREALAPMGSLVAEPGGVVRGGAPVDVIFSGETAHFDVLSGVGIPVIRYVDADTGNAPRRTVWVMTPGAMRARLAMLLPYNVAGVMIPDLAAAGVPAEMAAILDDFKVAQAAGAWFVPVISPLTLRWTATVNDAPVDQRTGDPAAPYVFTPATDGIRARIRAEIVELDTTLGEITVQSGQPTPQVEPTATSTPTATPSLETPLPPGG
ncbi:MAG: hypothetical protein IT323_16130 [Anaerolineae bacterium]|nr:hypothetical protein [Anaerolineae bacterium]